MDDPRRLIDEPGSSSLGRALLASARADVPSAESRVRLAKRLGIAAVLAAGASAGSEAGAIAATWKLAAVVVALTSVVGLAIWQSPEARRADRPVLGHSALRDPGGDAGDRASAPGPSPSMAPSAPAASAPVPGTPSPGVAPPAPSPSMTPPAPAASAPVPAPSRSGAQRPARSPSVALPVVPSSSAAPAVPRQTQPAPTPPAAAQVATGVPAPSARAGTEPEEDLAASPALEPAAAEPHIAEPPPAAEPPPVAAPAPTVIEPSRLAAEVALVDRARASLAAGDATAALAAIAEYHQRFPGGDLEAEADVVTIQAVIAQNDVARARSLGAAFLARFPRSPHAQRVRSLLDRLPK